MWLFDKVVEILAGKSTHPGEGTILAEEGAPTVSSTVYQNPQQWANVYAANYQEADKELYGEGGFFGLLTTLFNRSRIIAFAVIAVVVYLIFKKGF